MSTVEDLEEFEEQLRLMKDEKIRQESRVAEEAAQKKIYTDKDGTTYEWDDVKKAFFPKIDADFIAKYQANYGENEDDDEPESGDQAATQNIDYSKYQEKIYEQFYSDYKKYMDTFNTDSLNEKESEKEENIPMAYEDYYTNWYKYRAAAVYQSITGFQQPLSSQNEGQSKDGASPSDGKKVKSDEPPSWFEVDSEKNTNVYVSGLPTDVDLNEFEEIMSKYGIIQIDEQNKKPKLKLYRDGDGNIKGDGLCCFLKIESVALCLQLLDDYDLRGCKLKVQQAKFQQKGDYVPALKKRKQNVKSKKKKGGQEKLLDWKPDPLPGGRKKNERVVVVKNMFDPVEFEKDPTQILDYQKDIREECSKFGEVRKIQVYDLHPEGIVTITFKELEAADACIENLHGRFFASRQLCAEQWDGKTKFKVEETEEEKEERLKKWHRELEEEEEEEDEESGSKEKE